MTKKEALSFVEARGIVLESARGTVPNLAETVAGSPIHGSWWGHPRAHEIFRLTRAVRDSKDVLVCRLVDGKVTYIHRRLLPALVRVADRFENDRLAEIKEIHTPSGKHEVRSTPFPHWVPGSVMDAARNLTRAKALSELEQYMPDISPRNEQSTRT
ncbi:MAG: hypothetical protein ACE5GH_04440 [Fidelibacterota bacterium]